MFAVIWNIIRPENPQYDYPGISTSIAHHVRAKRSCKFSWESETLLVYIFKFALVRCSRPE